MAENPEKFYPRLHEDFQFNKNILNEAGLIQLATLYTEEGEPHEEEIGQFILDWLDPNDEIEVKTSGSTGEPKLIKVKKLWMVNSALATGKFFKLPEKTTALLCLPVSYIAGKMMLVRAMVLGWHLDSVPPKSNPLDQVYKRYDFCALTPFQLDNSLSRLHLIKKLIVGGAPVSTPLKNLVQGCPTKIYETYGMTETVSHIAARRINSKKSKKKELPFKVLPNVTVSQDERNCLVIKAPGVNKNSLVTNDVVELVTYKKFFWCGRYDHIINSGGVKIFPEQVEKKLESFILHRFFITSLPDDALGEKVILFIEAPFSEENLSFFAEELKNCCDLEKFEKPKKIYFIEKFEETHTGKVNKIATVKARLA
ncbi:AMP-binding protein [Mesonia sp. K7]|uniref:AMP-binding protein n=1 Tax=Mesonia sp. K7 TaxID=2218606 RepID=UPI000DA7B700|nr:AMP-binding protein [Mesonia sp. K7]PZD77253.1 O-succinylbenzoic acid--CoA ligase [Mesonia sp. K7]